MNSLLDVFARIAPGAAGLLAVYVAWRGLSTWRRQLHGGTEYELARRVLRSVLKVRDEIFAMRNPTITTGEVAAAEHEVAPSAGSDPLAPEGMEQRVYDRRWRRLASAWRELETDLLEAEVHWEEVRKKQIPLRECTGQLRVAVSMHLHALKEPSPTKTEMNALERWEKIYYDQSALGEDRDEFAERVDAAVKGFSHLLRKHIRKEKGG